MNRTSGVPFRPTVLLLLFLLGCRPAPRQVVLITIDTLRADRLGCYGAPADASPRIDEFAAGATLFEQTHCQAPWTSGSFASLLTGRYASEAMATSELQESPGGGGLTVVDHPVSPEIPILAEALGGAGFHNVAVLANPKLHAGLGYERGFHRYLELFRETGPSDPDGWTGKVTGDRVTRRTLELLPELRDRDFFLWVLYLDPHTPYIRHQDDYYPEGMRPGDRFPPDQPIRYVYSRPDHLRVEEGDPAPDLLDRSCPRLPIETLYRGEVRYVDEQVGRLLDALQQEGILDRALTIITSDHGESLYDHQAYFGHGAFPYQPTSRVPLMIRWPGAAPGRVAEPVALVDLVPTVLRHVGHQGWAGLRGAILSPRGRTEDPPILIETQGWRHRALRQGSHKLIQWGDGSKPEISLFDLAADPAERSDLAASRVRPAGELRGRLEQVLASMEAPGAPAEAVPVDPAIREQIRGLGYLN